jgi:hypothetical protein
MKYDDFRRLTVQDFANMRVAVRLRRDRFWANWKDCEMKGEGYEQLAAEYYQLFVEHDDTLAKLEGHLPRSVEHVINNG